MHLRRCRRSRRPTNRSSVHRVPLCCQHRYFKPPPFLHTLLCDILKVDPTAKRHRRSTQNPSQTTTSRRQRREYAPWSGQSPPRLPENIVCAQACVVCCGFRARCYPVRRRGGFSYSCRLDACYVSTCTKRRRISSRRNSFVGDAGYRRAATTLRQDGRLSEFGRPRAMNRASDVFASSTPSLCVTCVRREFRRRGAALALRKQRVIISVVASLTAALRFRHPATSTLTARRVVYRESLALREAIPFLINFLACPFAVSLSHPVI